MPKSTGQGHSLKIHWQMEKQSNPPLNLIWIGKTQLITREFLPTSKNSREPKGESPINPSKFSIHRELTRRIAGLVGEMQCKKPMKRKDKMISPFNFHDFMGKLRSNAPIDWPETQFEKLTLICQFGT